MPDGLVIAANRGPVSFEQRDDGYVAVHGGGGLTSALGPLVRETGATWVAAAMTDADRAVAGTGAVEAEGYRYRCIALDPDTYHQAYDRIANRTLWFMHHRLWDLARHPRFDATWRQAWDAYRTYNRTFAEAIASEAPEGAHVLVQDYHLSLVARWLGKERPDVRMVYFHHVPFCEPADLRVLPADVASELLDGLAANHACGFHTQRWADEFLRCCDDVLGQRPKTFVAPLGPDPASLAATGASADCAAAGRALDELIGDRRVILRVDRMEPSKNILRGFLAFDQLLRSRPSWAGRVVFIALAYPSRQHIAEYAAYRAEVEAVAAEINAAHGTPSWTPIVLDTRDDYARSVAALQRYDVLLVNPIRDGLNLVAKEGPILNRTDGVLVLSTEAGAWDEMAAAALPVQPFDVAATAEQLAVALDLTPEARRAHAGAVRAVAERRTPHAWLDDQLSA